MWLSLKKIRILNQNNNIELYFKWGFTVHKFSFCKGQKFSFIQAHKIIFKAVRIISKSKSLKEWDSLFYLHKIAEFYQIDELFIIN